MKKLLFLLSIITLSAQAKLYISQIYNPIEKSDMQTNIIKTDKGFESLNKDTIIGFDSIDDLPNGELVFGYSKNNLYKINKDKLTPLFKRDAAIALTNFAAHSFPVPFVMELVTDKNREKFLGKDAEGLMQELSDGTQYAVNWPWKQSDFIKPEKVQ